MSVLHQEALSPSAAAMARETVKGLSMADAPGINARLSQFARLLRDNGFSIGPGEVSDAITALATRTGSSSIPTARQLKLTLRLLWCHRRSELQRFDDIFDAYWLRRARFKRTVFRETRASQTRGVGGREASAGAGGSGLARYFDWADQAETGSPQVDAVGQAAQSLLGGASRRAVTGTVDFGTVADPEERAELLALADRLGARMRHTITRRRRAATRGTILDFRRTLQRCIGHGAIPAKLLHKRPRTPPVSLLLFVDVSGSMDAYSLFFMRFVHALTGRFQQAQSFIFHTKLVHVTGALRDADPERMMQRMTLMSQGWSGGTRIGGALATFNQQYARSFCSSRSVAIILSDGFDTGEARVLDEQLLLLKRRCHRIIWLNPLLGRESYQPVSTGMTAARRHIDLFAAAHNLNSLAALEDAIVRA